jgi:hypothetical protein
MKTRYPGSGLAAFLIIAVIAPPLGALGPLTCMLIREAILAGDKVTFASLFDIGRIIKFLFWSYMLAGPSTLFAGIYAGARIYSIRWVPLRETVILAAALAPLIPAIGVYVFRAFGYPETWSDLLSAEFMLFALLSTLLSVALAIVTALILRLPMLRLKILVPPAATAHSSQ